MKPTDGKAAVRLARQAAELWVTSKQRLEPKRFPKSFDEKRGVFVTLHTYPEKELRGCIGFPEPVYALKKGIVEAAVHACKDPRFPPLDKKELNKVIIEVSVLTEPEMLFEAPEDRVKAVRIGKDGLIIIKGPHSGLLLPQVATEYGMTNEEFIQAACGKAMLPKDAWKDPETEVYVFQCDVFSEKKPGLF